MVGVVRIRVGGRSRSIESIKERKEHGAYGEGSGECGGDMR